MILLIILVNLFLKIDWLFDNVPFFIYFLFIIIIIILNTILVQLFIEEHNGKEKLKSKMDDGSK